MEAEPQQIIALVRVLQLVDHVSVEEADAAPANMQVAASVMAGCGDRQLGPNIAYHEGATDEPRA